MHPCSGLQELLNAALGRRAVTRSEDVHAKEQYLKMLRTGVPPVREGQNYVRGHERKRALSCVNCASVDGMVVKTIISDVSVCIRVRCDTR